MRARSDKTEIRRLRSVLRLCITVCRAAEDPSASFELRRDLASAARWQIDRLLAPKRPRRQP